jgi:hypothetical protein
MERVVGFASMKSDCVSWVLLLNETAGKKS